jgi:hypothetical protein
MHSLLLGKIQFGTKSGLVWKSSAHHMDRLQSDGAAIINMLKPIGVKSFQDYDKIFF